MLPRILTICLIGTPALADIVMLRSGLEVQGDFGETSSLGSDALSPLSRSTAVDVKLIRFVDDGLRRSFFSRYQLQDRRPDVEQWEKIRVPQPVATSAARGIGIVGELSGSASPFDRHGRRTVSLVTSRGPVEVLQGITEITPIYTRVEGMQTSTAYKWDMRMATSSLSPDRLEAILTTALDMNQPDDRLKMVRLYLQSERYGEAEEALRDAMATFPELEDLNDQLAQLQLLRSRQQLQEIRLRWDTGQVQLAQSMLQSFPTDDVPPEVLAEVQSVAEDLGQVVTNLRQAVAILDRLREEMPEAVARARWEPVLDEIKANVRPHSLSRVSELLRREKDEQLDDVQKLALAVSGWLTGGAANARESLTSSLIQVRLLVEEYLVCRDVMRRQAIVEELRSEEAGTPDLVAKVLNAMTPPKRDDVPQPVTTDDSTVIPGCWQIEVPGLLTGQSFRYAVQLPPEYDPRRRYPTIVSLTPLGGDQLRQLEWWAGPYDSRFQMRLGQAGRHGYIVIAPYWARDEARRYEYSAQEHAAVLYSLRDACQRYSVDVDRVFLSGHFAGGDAAWDIGLAHPDQWAGMILIGAAAQQDRPDAPKYVTQYWPNAKFVPSYFVFGEKDTQRMALNAMNLDRYLTKTGIDALVVEYRGRGREHFVEEIHRMFRWMQYQRRDVAPPKFEVFTRRSWDNFFWYVELQGISPRSLILPVEWPAKNKARPFPVRASVREKDSVYIGSKNADEITVFLSPEMVDFDAAVTVYQTGRVKARNVVPDLEVLLEDARTRGDRQHPFWAKVVL